MRLCPALLVLAAVACGPPPVVMPDAGDPCAAPAKTPPSLVKNGGFECGGAAPAEWAPAYGDFVIAAEGHGGARSGKVTVGGGALGSFGSAAAVVTAVTAKTYCAIGWLKGTSTNAKLSVMVDTGGGGVEYGFTAPMTSAWTRMPPSTNLQVPAPAGSKVSFVFRALDGKAGDVLFVDDVDLWESADGKCQESR